MTPKLFRRAAVGSQPTATPNSSISSSVVARLRSRVKYFETRSGSKKWPAAAAVSTVGLPWHGHREPG